MTEKNSLRPIPLYINGEHGLLTRGRTEEPPGSLRGTRITFSGTCLSRLAWQGHALLHHGDRKFLANQKLAALEAVSARARLTVRQLDLKKLETDLGPGFVSLRRLKDIGASRPIGIRTRRLRRVQTLLLPSRSFLEVRGEPLLSCVAADVRDHK